MSEAKLRVWANPFHAYDHDGRLSGALLCDPVEHLPYTDALANKKKFPDPTDRRWEERRFVGATRSGEHLKEYDPKEHGHMVDFTDVTFEFSKDTQEIPSTKYYVNAVRAGSIFAADEETAKECGVSFLPYEKATANARKVLAADWRAHYPEAQLPDWAQPPISLVKQPKKEVA